MDSEPFRDLSDDKYKAFISMEAFFAFSHEESRIAISSFLISMIKEETISEAYKNNRMDMNWMVAEDMIAFTPFLGFLVAI